MPAAMPWRLQHRKHKETCCTVGQHKTKYACIVEADESLRIRMEGSQSKSHEDHIEGRGMNSLSHYNLVHKFNPMPQALKIPDAKAAVEKELEKLEKIPAWLLTKVKNKSEVIAEARNKGPTIHYASSMDLCHLKNWEFEPQFQKYKGRVVLQAYQDAQDMQQMQYLLTPRSKWKMHHVYERSEKSECPDIWIRLPTHKWPKSWSSMEDPVVPLERNLYGHLLAGLLWERQFEKILLKHGWEKIPNCECLFVHREEGLFLSVHVDDIKLAGKKQNLDPMWTVLNKKSIWENQHLSWIMYTWDALKESAK